MTTATKSTPTTVMLSPALRAAAKRRASERGMSVSAYVRELITEDDARSSPSGDISLLIGLMGDDLEPTDIGRDKHEMIREAVVQTSGIGDRW